MGGSDDKDNLISLTNREHYLAHCLLALAFPEISGLTKCVFFFKSKSKNSRIYEKISSYSHSEETKRKISLSNKGKTRKRKEKMSLKEKEQRSNLRKELNKSQSHRLKMKEISKLETASWRKNFKLSYKNGRNGIKNPKANKEVWLNYEFLYQTWIDNGKPGFKKLHTITQIGKSPQSLKTIVKKFKDEDIVRTKEKEKSLEIKDKEP